MWHNAEVEVESIPVSLWHLQHYAGASVIFWIPAALTIQLIWTTFSCISLMSYLTPHKVMKLHVHVKYACHIYLSNHS